MDAVVVTMAILLIPGDRKNNAPSGIQDRSLLDSSKDTSRQRRPTPILNTTAGRCRAALPSPPSGPDGSLPVPKRSAPFCRPPAGANQLRNLGPAVNGMAAERTP